MSDIDRLQIEAYLDLAAMQDGQSPFALGLWLGRALEAARQNAVDLEWLKAAFEERDLDSALVEEPKVGRPQG